MQCIFQDRKDCTKEYIFRSFWDRDDCYSLLMEILGRTKRMNDDSINEISESRQIAYSSLRTLGTNNLTQNISSEASSPAGNDESSDNPVWKSIFRSVEDEFETGRCDALFTIYFNVLINSCIILLIIL